MDAPIVRFSDIECNVVFGRYEVNNQACIRLVVADTQENTERKYHVGGVVATATVCVADSSFDSNVTVIKNHSENEGILQALVDGRVVEPTGGIIDLGDAIGTVVMCS